MTDGVEHTFRARTTCASAHGLLEHLELILEILTLASGACGEALRLVRHHCVAGFVLHDWQEDTPGAEQGG